MTNEQAALAQAVEYSKRQVAASAQDVAKFAQVFYDWLQSVEPPKRGPGRPPNADKVRTPE